MKLGGGVLTGERGREQRIREKEITGRRVGETERRIKIQAFGRDSASEIQ